MPRAEFIGSLKRFLQAEGFIAKFDDDIGAAEFAGELRCFAIHACSERRDINVGFQLHIASCFLQGKNQAVFADGESNARSLGTAESFRESVVASAAKNGVLRAKRAVRELKSRARVVVKSAHQAVI